ncbi:MAG: hypothetical protein RIR26_2861 [Pseudomonadota bacterium]|jgi:tetratricopeptide (TPR) repeat protein
MRAEVCSKRSKRTLWAVVLGAAIAAVALSVTACGVLSSPDREETPSRLILKAQAAYDAGKYDEAISLLEKAVDKDPSNVEARVRLAFSYNGSLGISPTTMIKSLAGGSSSGSGSSDITKLTGGAGLSKEKTDAIQDADKAGTLTTVAQLRKDFEDFAKFQKAFLVLCPLFSTTTLSSLREKAESAVTLMEVKKCGSGLASSDANVSIAALSLAIQQFASLYNAILDPNGDGKIDVQEKATEASDKIKNLSTSGGGDPTQNLASLNTAMTSLTTVAATLKGEIFKLAIAQFSIISAVAEGSNLPDSVKTPLKKAVDGLDAAIGKVNEYLDAGKTTAGAAGGASGSVATGTAAKDAADKANAKANDLLTNASDADKLKTCNQVYCLRSTYGLPNDDANMPTNCTGLNYSKTCAQ